MYIYNYRFGFNGKESDNEVSGEGNTVDYGFRVNDTRLGRFFSIDPLTKKYAWYTPYQFAGNKPIEAIDIEGLEEYYVIQNRDNTGKITSISIVTFIDKNNNIQNQNIIMNGIDYSKDKILVVDIYSDGSKVYKGKDKFSKIQNEINSSIKHNKSDGIIVDGILFQDGSGGKGRDFDKDQGVQRYIKGSDIETTVHADMEYASNKDKKHVMKISEKCDEYKIDGGTKKQQDWLEKYLKISESDKNEKNNTNIRTDFKFNKKPTFVALFYKIKKK